MRISHALSIYACSYRTSINSSSHCLDSTSRRAVDPRYLVLFMKRACPPTLFPPRFRFSLSCHLNSKASKCLILSRLNDSHLSHSKHHIVARVTKRLEPRKAVLRTAAPLGTLPVDSPPRYQLPISVSLPSCVSIAEFAPTLDTSERKAPKYE